MINKSKYGYANLQSWRYEDGGLFDRQKTIDAGFKSVVYVLCIADGKGIIPDGSFYIGSKAVHLSSFNSYLGSSSNEAFKDYIWNYADDIERLVVSRHRSLEKAVEKERELLLTEENGITYYEMLECLNLSLPNEGFHACLIGDKNPLRRPEVREAIRQANIGNSNALGNRHTERTKALLRKNAKEQWNDPDYLRDRLEKGLIKPVILTFERKEYLLRSIGECSKCIDVANKSIRMWCNGERDPAQYGIQVRWMTQCDGNKKFKNLIEQDSVINRIRETMNRTMHRAYRQKVELKFKGREPVIIDSISSCGKYINNRLQTDVFYYDAVKRCIKDHSKLPKEIEYIKMI